MYNAMESSPEGLRDFAVDFKGKLIKIQIKGRT